MAYAGDLKSLAARIVGSSPTAPTMYYLRARVLQGCGPVSFGRRWGSNPRGGERQADAQRPQRAGEGAGRRPKPVRICAANTRTSHRPYHVIVYEPAPLWDAGSLLLDAGTDGKLRWNSSYLCCLPAYLGTISPQLRLMLPHFSMEKRGCLAHFSMEKRGCLTHFPREMRIRPYIILCLGERALRSARPLHERSFVFCGVCGVGEVEMKRNAFLRRCRFRIVVHVRPLRHQPTCLVRGGFTPCDSPHTSALSESPAVRRGAFCGTGSTRAIATPKPDVILKTRCACRTLQALQDDGLPR